MAFFDYFSIVSFIKYHRRRVIAEDTNVNFSQMIFICSPGIQGFPKEFSQYIQTNTFIEL